MEPGYVVYVLPSAFLTLFVLLYFTFGVVFIVFLSRIYDVLHFVFPAILDSSCCLHVAHLCPLLLHMFLTMFVLNTDEWWLSALNVVEGNLA